MDLTLVRRPTAGEINDLAANWLHRVDIGEICPEDAALQTWLTVPRHYVAYRRLQLAWERAEILKRHPAAVLGVDPYSFDAQSDIF
jgi:ferric-dicitrate binding protein FerR (iron transport regulator)